MSRQLQEINRSLHSLDAAYRGDRITREDYRSRRRHLLAVLRDGGGITARSKASDDTTRRSQIATAGTTRGAVGNRGSAGTGWSRLRNWKHWFSGSR